MKLSRLTPAQKIDIWQPRWKDRIVLVAKHKIGTHNEITFSKAESLKGNWYISGEKARSFPLDSNGKIPCYAIPLSELEPLDRV